MKDGIPAAARGAEIIMAGGAAAKRNWDGLVAHTEAEWAGDLDGTMETITRNAPFQIMYATGLNVHGWEEVREFYRERMNTFQGQGFQARRWVVTDDIIIGNGYFSGTPKGVFFGTKSIGKQLCLPMNLWIYFEGGLLKGEAVYTDGLEMQRQLREGTNQDLSAPLY